MGKAAAGEQRCHSPARDLQIYLTPTPRAGTTEATSPEQAVLRAQPRAQTPTALSPREQRGRRLPRRLTYPSPRPLARPQRQPLLLHPADALERTQEANSLTFTNPISLSPRAAPLPCCAPSFHLPNKKQAPSKQLSTDLLQKQDRETRSLAAPQGRSAIIEANKP